MSDYAHNTMKLEQLQYDLEMSLEQLQCDLEMLLEQFQYDLKMFKIERDAELSVNCQLEAEQCSLKIDSLQEQINNINSINN